MERVYDTPLACCGCTLCAEQCPTSAISMEEIGGFSYPQIEAALCVDCGKCRQVCVIQNPCQIVNAKQAYAARLNHTQSLLKSSSGGVFTALSDGFLEKKDAVCGVKWDKKMQPCYAVTVSRTERNQMRGSKYVQADMRGVFEQLEKQFAVGKRVLFSGTPCSVAAVKRYFADQPLLFTVDLICHGVPSPVVWRAFVAYLEGAFGKRLKGYSFRDKQNGWHQYHAVATFVDGTTVQDTAQTDSFLELFQYDLCLRDACTACPYAKEQRVGDITVGDFWGVQHLFSQLDDEKGVSAVLVNTKKGEELLSMLQQRMQLLPCAVSDVVNYQKPMQSPSKKSVKADAFARDFAQLSFDKVLKKYTRLGVSRRFKDAVKKALGRV